MKKRDQEGERSKVDAPLPPAKENEQEHVSGYPPTPAISLKRLVESARPFAELAQEMLTGHKTGHLPREAPRALLDAMQDAEATLDIRGRDSSEPTPAISNAGLSFDFVLQTELNGGDRIIYPIKIHADHADDLELATRLFRMSYPAFREFIRQQTR